jgi:hypothetical protein
VAKNLKSKTVPTQPLAEVFGHKVTDHSASAKKHRNEELCPFNNVVPRCTKDKSEAPLGVCSINHSSETVVICPVRFREKWKISADAAEFFFGADKNYSALKEVRLKERSGKSAGNIDLVIAKHSASGKVIDFGAVEVQSVYVSGNIRNPFEHYMENPIENCNMDWTGEKNYPRPDFLSSSRKRLAPQMIYKGQILRAWHKKLAVVVDQPFFNTLPIINQTPKEKADVCWLVYELKEVGDKNRLELNLAQKVYTSWDDVFKSIANPDIGDVSEFISVLESKLSAIISNPDFAENTVHDWA